MLSLKDFKDLKIVETSSITGGTHIEYSCNGGGGFSTMGNDVDSQEANNRCPKGYSYEIITANP
jgi:hypothetical protein